MLVVFWKTWIINLQLLSWGKRSPENYNIRLSRVEFSHPMGRKESRWKMCLTNLMEWCKIWSSHIRRIQKVLRTTTFMDKKKLTFPNSVLLKLLLLWGQNQLVPVRNESLAGKLQLTAHVRMTVIQETPKSAWSDLQLLPLWRSAILQAFLSEVEMKDIEKFSLPNPHKNQRHFMNTAVYN